MKQTLAQSEIVSTFFHCWIMLHIKMNSWNHSTNVWAEFFFIRACFAFGSFPQLRYTIYVFQFTIKIFFSLLLFALLPSTYSLLTEKKVSIDLEDGFARFNLPSRGSVVMVNQVNLLADPKRFIDWFSCCVKSYGVVLRLKILFNSNIIVVDATEAF